MYPDMSRIIRDLDLLPSLDSLEIDPSALPHSRESLGRGGIASKLCETHLELAGDPVNLDLASPSIRARVPSWEIKLINRKAVKVFRF